MSDIEAEEIRSEKTTHNGETFAFQAEINRVMDIVVNSLYTDREIFLRELISNAVDALEKMRHFSLISHSAVDKDETELPFEIRIETDEAGKRLIIRDTGVGLTRDELIENLGSIAHSGSREFFEKLEANLKKDVRLIGQFGIGFYSCFMVASQVVINTRSFRSDATGLQWSSDGKNGFTIRKAPVLQRGTSIELQLKEDSKEFAKADRIKELVTKYSNFVPFPIFLNDERVNTVQALWARRKDEISEEEYINFYQFISGRKEKPLTYLHFTVDAPLSITALLYVPADNLEQYGFGKLDPAVDLHCRKVLIQKKPPKLLPHWLRMLQGVIDSEDLPLNISRETMQDSSLVKRLSRAVTSRFIKFLKEEMTNNPEKYLEIWKTFGSLIKEGIITDITHGKDLAPLLRFETSSSENETLVSLDEYIERMVDGQKEIYYLFGNDKKALESSPYLEIFKERGIEVIFTYDPGDDFVFSHLEKYKEFPFVSADAERLDLPGDKEKGLTEKKHRGLSDDEVKGFKEWAKRVLKDKVGDVRASRRLSQSPAILVNPVGKISSAMQRFLQIANKQEVHYDMLTFEFNPEHDLIIQLNEKRKDETLFPEIVLQHLLDQAAIAAGFSVESQQLLDRMSTIVARAMQN